MVEIESHARSSGEWNFLGADGAVGQGFLTQRRKEAKG